MGKNRGFSQQIQRWKDTWIKAAKSTYMQYLTDTMVLVLNDMGYGEKRIRDILDKWGNAFDEYFDCLTNEPTADYARAKMDERIAAICKSGDWEPFEKRYPYLPEFKYDIRR